MRPAYVYGTARSSHRSQKPARSDAAGGCDIEIGRCSKDLLHRTLRERAFPKRDGIGTHEHGPDQLPVDLTQMVPSVACGQRCDALPISTPRAWPCNPMRLCADRPSLSARVSECTIPHVCKHRAAWKPPPRCSPIRRSHLSRKAAPQDDGSRMAVRHHGCAAWIHERGWLEAGVRMH